MDRTLNEQIAALAAELAEAQLASRGSSGEQEPISLSALTFDHGRVFRRLLNHPQVLIKLGILLGQHCEERGIGQASSGVIGGPPAPEFSVGQLVVSSGIGMSQAVGWPAEVLEARWDALSGDNGAWLYRISLASPHSPAKYRDCWVYGENIKAADIESEENE